MLRLYTAADLRDLPARRACAGAVTHELDLAAQAHRRIKLVDWKITEDSG